MLYFQNLNLSFSLFLFSGILVAVFRYAVHVAVVMFSTLHACLFDSFLDSIVYSVEFQNPPHSLVRAVLGNYPMTSHTTFHFSWQGSLIGVQELY